MRENVLGTIPGRQAYYPVSLQKLGDNEDSELRKT